MLENLPVKSLPFQGYTIEGYSRAAVQSYWRIPELRVGFDMGGTPWSFMGTQTYFITHAHLDHMAAAPRLCGAAEDDEDGARRRSMCRRRCMRRPTGC